MNPLRLLEQARALGILLSVSGGKLRYEAPAGRLTEELRRALVEHKPAILDLLQSERLTDAPAPYANTVRDREPVKEVSGRLIGRAVTLLLENGGSKYAVVTDAESDPDFVLVAIAIRGRATCEARIPRDRYDGFLLLDLIEKHSGTLH